MKKFLVMAALMVATLSANAQEYNWAVGLRGGAFSGLTVKKNNDANALEFGASWGLGNYIVVDGVYEWQQPVITEGFNLYYGAGAFLGAFENDFAVGAEGVVGLEYKIPDFPLAFSFDYRPSLNALHIGNLNGLYNFGLGIKYCF